MVKIERKLPRIFIAHSVYCRTWLVSGVGHRLSQHLHGKLAGLLVLNNHTEADHVIQCINSCEQKLDFHAINEMETGMVSFAAFAARILTSVQSETLHSTLVSVTPCWAPGL